MADAMGTKRLTINPLMPANDDVNISNYVQTK